MKAKQIPFYLITIALFIGIISPSLLSDGMFADGVTYAAISKNLADGLGSLWNLQYTNTIYLHFHEHPPLAFGLQSLLFRIFGDSILVERIYSLSTFLITGFIIVSIWKRVTDSTFHSLAWLPLLFWISIPLLSWAAPNNMLENTMMIFTSLSVLLILTGLETNRLLYLFLSGIMLFLGCLTKGFVALFPLSLPFWIYIFQRSISFKRFLTDTLIILAGTILPFLVIFVMMPESLDSLLAYFERQIVGSIQDVQTVDSRFFILGRLIVELIPGLIVVLVVYLFSRKYKPTGIQFKMSYIFLGLGLSGVVPIMISLKQSGYYILASLPFFSIALACLVAPRVKYLVGKINIQNKRFVVFRYFSFVLLIFSLSLMILHSNRIGRDKEMIEDIYRLMEIIPDGTTISVQSKLRDDWSLIGYFQRYANISLDLKKPFSSKYILVENGFTNESLFRYEKHAVTLHRYDLYER